MPGRLQIGVCLRELSVFQVDKSLRSAAGDIAVRVEKGEDLKQYANQSSPDTIEEGMQLGITNESFHIPDP